MAESRADRVLIFGAKHTKEMTALALASELLSHTPGNLPLLSALVTNEVASAAHLAAIGIAVGAFTSWVLDPRPFTGRSTTTAQRDLPKSGNPIRVLREEVMVAISTGLYGKTKRYIEKPMPLYLGTSQDKYGHRNYDVSWIPEPEIAYYLRLRHITPKAQLRTYNLNASIDWLDFFHRLDEFPYTKGIPNTEMLRSLRDTLPLLTAPQSI